MSRAMSIHIGVNRPCHRQAGGRPLQYSEITAWRMAELANQAGYDSLQVLQGQAATRSAVLQALSGAAGVMSQGDTLLVTFSGHGVPLPDQDGDERDGLDESWCLADSTLRDDELAEHWRLFERGVRIAVVAESCYSGGSGRDDKDYVCVPPRPGGGQRFRGTRGAGMDDQEAGNPCIVEAASDDDDIRASVLLLAASGEKQSAHDGVFTRYLLDVWQDGTFRGSYCNLFREVHRRVTAEYSSQHPQLKMLGAPDPEFSMAPAFHRDGTTRGARYRGAIRMVG
ncbi:caspase family protein [Longimicrobium terrae]|uniref:Peptidase C14 caspase domain-containing protein n=1 Tax=Longimicrobium terrae TaxID=1639882 RepID=A0A841GZE2_9BACT|nr:caspase family protein [Longimicrobium terrae]MBB4636878.1 hypothetical protein [Longimicrobium terrae]MBB6071123.1 hypothetical protein [Longimicrobium terrae]NNC29172.1 caspase family protein [Longimicrobium terrae]